MVLCSLCFDKSNCTLGPGSNETSSHVEHGFKDGNNSYGLLPFGLIGGSVCSKGKLQLNLICHTKCLPYFYSGHLEQICTIKLV